MWLKMATVASRKLAAGDADGDARRLETKLATARFYFAKLLPQVHALGAQIAAGAAPVMALGAEAF
jgi:acyl-CoA dehydrogenase